MKSSAHVDLNFKLQNLKDDGEAPQWMTEESFTILSKSYLLAGETPKGMYTRLAHSAAKVYEDRADEWETKFFDVLWKNWLCPASPVLSNMGTDRGLPLSCNSVHLGDSVTDIFDTLHEMAMLSKHGAGVGVYAGDIRARGTPIHGNGQSEGIVPWMKVFDAATHATSQGSTRRGATAFYLPIDHGDFEEYLNIRRATGDLNRQCLNLNHAVTITNKWMEEMIAGDVEKRERWQKLLQTRLETGEPYILFIDNVNDRNPECYKGNGLTVKTSNLCCLSGDTEVEILKDGKIEAVSIKELAEKRETVTIFDGEDWVENSGFELKGKGALTRLSFEGGEAVDCTDNHRWFVEVHSKHGNYAEEYLTSHLDVGHELETVGTATIAPFITGIRRLPGEHDVYCTTVPSTGKFALANGLMTGNSEIVSFTDPDHTFICMLSSLNLAKWEEWKDSDLPEISTRFLDACLSEYIAKIEDKPMFKPAWRSATKGRSLGLGVLGWHSLLQSKDLPFDSFQSMQLNAKVFSTIRKGAEKATKEMAEEFGEPEWCKGYGRRNSQLMACAPTVSNSAISGGYSAGIEPLAANTFNVKGATGTFIRHNPKLEEVLESLGQNTPEVWKSIIDNAGSVRHLDFLSEEQKKVFLTAREINQHAIVKQACQRQAWVDQAQSVNLFFAANSAVQYIHEVHLNAWKEGLKSLYYCRSSGVIAGDLASRGAEECEACSG